MQNEDYSNNLSEKIRSEAEEFVYSCLLDFMKSGAKGKNASHSYFMSEDEFVRYFNISPVIKAIALDENLNVEFKVTKRKEYVIIFTRLWKKATMSPFFVQILKKKKVFL